RGPLGRVARGIAGELDLGLVRVEARRVFRELGRTRSLHVPRIERIGREEVVVLRIEIRDGHAEREAIREVAEELDLGAVGRGLRGVLEDRAESRGTAAHGLVDLLPFELVREYRDVER